MPKSRAVRLSVLMGGALSLMFAGSPGHFEAQGATPSPVEPDGSAALNADSDYLPTPGGVKIHKSCGHTVPVGAAVAPNGDIVMGGPNGRVIEHVEPCKYPPIPQSGHTAGLNSVVEWVSDYPTNGATWFNEVASSIVVPAAPGPFGEEVDLWVGLESQGNGNMVLQPVLHYSTGSVPPGCSSFQSSTGWAMLNYYIDQNGTPYCGAVTSPVYPGDDIYMGVTLDSTQGCNNNGTGCAFASWYYVNGNGPGGLEVYGEPLQLNEANLGALEFYYSGTNCAALPPAVNGGLTFTLDALNVAVPQWYNYTNAGPYSYWQTQTASPPGVPNCGYQPQFTDAVHLNYHN